MNSYLILPVLLIIVKLQSQVSCDSSSSPAGEDTSEAIPLLASGKRQHNIMRFGKRPAGGHSLIHFGKRDDEGSPTSSSSSPQHSFLYFGKRDRNVPDLWDYLQKNGEGSYKRGHSIMRFGKRAPESHNFIRFGRDPEDEEEDVDKRATNNGHAMMYFGKRGGTSNNGHSMMYFGKRGTSPSGHSMMYFGKREPYSEDDDDVYNGKRAHAMIHFGKRDEDRGRSHAMIHFGKRGEDGNRGKSHAMIHFGKRDIGDESDVDSLYWSPEILEAKRQHNLLRFGKKMDRKGSHAMIHFGKRDVDEDKRAHAMIHFGKRSLQDVAAPANQSSKSPQSRVKREAEQRVEPLVTLVNYEDPEEGITFEENPKIPSNFASNDFWSQPLEEEWESPYGVYQPDKKDASKNVFLRFG